MWLNWSVAIINVMLQFLDISIGKNLIIMVPIDEFVMQRAQPKLF